MFEANSPDINPSFDLFVDTWILDKHVDDVDIIPIKSSSKEDSDEILISDVYSLSRTLQRGFGL